MANSQARKRRKKEFQRRRRVKERSQSSFSRMVAVSIIVVAFLSIMGTQIYHLRQKDAEYARRQEALQIEYEEELQRAKDLENLADYMKTTQYIENVAKTKLGLAYENEIIFKEKKEE